MGGASQVVRWQAKGDPLDARSDAAQVVTKRKAKAGLAGGSRAMLGVGRGGERAGEGDHR